MNVQVSQTQAEKAASHEFFCGFAQASNLPSPMMAVGVWMDYSQFVTKKHRKELEQGGRESGIQQGEGFCHLLAAMANMKDQL